MSMKSYPAALSHRDQPRDASCVPTGGGRLRLSEDR